MRENVGDCLHVEREAAYGLWAYEGGIETESKRAGRAFRSVRRVNRQFHQKLNPQNPPGLPGGQSDHNHQRSHDGRHRRHADDHPEQPSADAADGDPEQLRLVLTLVHALVSVQEIEHGDAEQRYEG